MLRGSSASTRGLVNMRDADEVPLRSGPAALTNTSTITAYELTCTCAGVAACLCCDSAVDLECKAVSCPPCTWVRRLRPRAVKHTSAGGLWHFLQNKVSCSTASVDRAYDDVVIVVCIVFRWQRVTMAVMVAPRSSSATGAEQLHCAVRSSQGRTWPMATHSEHTVAWDNKHPHLQAVPPSRSDDQPH